MSRRSDRCHDDRTDPFRRPVVRRVPQLLSLALLAGSLLVAPSVEAKPKPHKPVKHGYVVSQLQVPVGSTEAQQLGLDLNGDGKVDNRLGQVFGALAAQGFDVQGLLGAAFGSGSLVTLLSVQTKNLKNAKGVRVRLFRGVPGTTRVDKTAPVTELKAKIKKKAIVPKPGTVHLALPGLLPGRPVVTLDLRQGRILATCRANGCVAGRIVGGIPTEQVDQRLVPELGAVVRAVVARDCPTTPPDPCTPDTQGAQLLQLFDADHDGTVTDQELRDSVLIKGLLAPDLDLVGGDGVADSLSVGVGFTAAAAKVRGD
jgi:hypothetical protein